jgi:hypothetical protein
MAIHQGRQPVARVVQAPAPAIRPRNSVAYFEYAGKTALTIIGPVSGAIYRFPAPGSRAAIDFHDSKGLATVPHLIRVGSL